MRACIRHAIWAVCALLPFVLCAHPHAFVDTELDFHIEDGQLTALHIHWRLDPLTSEFTLVDFGIVPEPEGFLREADALYLQEQFSIWPEDYAGDSVLEAGGEAVALAGPKDMQVWLDAAGHLNLAFMRPLIAPQPARGAFRARVYDPEFFTYYEVVTGPAIKGDSACAARWDKVEDNAEIARLSEEFAEYGATEDLPYDNAGALYADDLMLLCDD